jgi:hypothetical protein
MSRDVINSPTACIYKMLKKKQSKRREQLVVRTTYLRLAMIKDTFVIWHGGGSPDLLLHADSDVLGVPIWNLRCPNLQYQARNYLIG